MYIMYALDSTGGGAKIRPRKTRKGTERYFNVGNGCIRARSLAPPLPSSIQTETTTQTKRAEMDRNAYERTNGGGTPTRKDIGRSAKSIVFELDVSLGDALNA